MFIRILRIYKVFNKFGKCYIVFIFEIYVGGVFFKVFYNVFFNEVLVCCVGWVDFIYIFW